MQQKYEIQSYLEHKINPIFEEMLSDIIKQRPKNLLLYCKQWFDQRLETTQQCIDNNYSSDEEEEEYLNDKEIQEKKAKAKWCEQRKGICGQVYGSHHLWEDFQLPINSKKSTVNSRILFRLKSLFLFKDFDDNDIWKLINAMQEETHLEGMIVVQQGDSGDQIYIVDSGELDCIKNVNHQEVYIRSIKEGEMFGEMSMLYNVPRSATVKVHLKTTLFKLSRKTFYSIINQKNIKKRKIFQNAIQKIDMLRELEPEEKNKLEDLIKEIPVHLNQYIIREGKPNNKFYIIQSGKFVSIKKQKNGHEKIIANFKENDYFGEYCLLSKKLATESILALTNGKLYAFQSQAFQRVLGPISKILKRSLEIYQRYKNFDNV